MYEVVIDDIWDGRIMDVECETEERANEWVEAYRGNDTFIRIYKNNQLYKEV